MMVDIVKHMRISKAELDALDEGRWDFDTTASPLAIDFDNGKSVPLGMLLEAMAGELKIIRARSEEQARLQAKAFD